MWLRPRPFLSLFALLLLCTHGCGIPRDPNATLERVRREGVVRVGVIDNAPWAKRAGAEPTGVEAELVRRFAGEIGARPQWVWGSEHELVEALMHGEIDLMIGGLIDSSPWSREVAFTNPYFTNEIVVGVPPTQSPIKEVEGKTVAVRSGTSAAAHLREKDAVLHRVDDPFGANAPVAAPLWELEKHGFTRTEIELAKEKHVWAAPPGENRWLVRLDDFLHSQRSQVKSLLQREAQSSP